MGVRLKSAARRAGFAMLAIGAVTAAPSVLADAGKAGLIYVTTTPNGARCEIDADVRGPSPLLARVAEGEHAVTCRVDVANVAMVRTAKVVVADGKGTRVTIDLQGAP
jgi:hypothetical protein